jgi:Mlc titration factor MtfA (ptsG expression regulator)
MDPNTRIVLLLFIMLLMAGLWFSRGIFRSKKRSRVKSMPFPDVWSEIISENIPVTRRLPDNLRENLNKEIQVFVSEKEFIGCAGLEITDEIKVTIAAQACLLNMNREHFHYPSCYTILVYPDSFITEHYHHHGDLVSLHQNVTHGESHERGPVVLAWSEVVKGASHPSDGHNVVFHEFAHQLDQESGRHNGVPYFEDIDKYRAWVNIVGREYEDFTNKVFKNLPTIIDEYGATNEAEFFAVISGAFFEKPHKLKKHKPELYQQLVSFYNLDPANW